MDDATLDRMYNALPTATQDMVAALILAGHKREEVIPDMISVTYYEAIIAQDMKAAARERALWPELDAIYCELDGVLDADDNALVDAYSGMLAEGFADPEMPRANPKRSHKKAKGQRT